MTLVNMNQLLEVARNNNFAVGAYNVSNLELMRTSIEQCEADYAPAIIMIHPTELRYFKDDRKRVVQGKGVDVCGGGYMKKKVR